jgi:ABC-2 type transport system ATP-binding protein
MVCTPRINHSVDTRRSFDGFKKSTLSLSKSRRLVDEKSGFFAILITGLIISGGSKMESIITVEHLCKTYGDVLAVDDVSLTVKKGEIFGVIGPNGAGKTTIVESLIGLRKPDTGRIRVMDLDPHSQGRILRQRIGIQLQEAVLPDQIKVWEALDLFASYYDHTVDWNLLLDQWGLTEKRNKRFSQLSGGQKQRLFIALSLLNDPEIVFLDELTTGLDPQARRKTWDLIRAIRGRGKTVILVTHFMDEAQELCDRIAIIDRGKRIALDSPTALIQSLDAEREVRFRAPAGFTPNILEKLPEVNRVVSQNGTIKVYGQGPLIARVATRLAENNLELIDFHAESANLEDVFLALTGRDLRD